MSGFIRVLFNVPNSMSLLRIVAAPLLLVFWIAMDMPVLGLVVGTIIGITDLFDGILARKLGQVTQLGALIDQLGDLIFESCAIMVGMLLGEIPVALFVIYLFREFTVSVIRTYVIGNAGKLPSSWIGKAKSSLLQYSFFPMFLGCILIRPGVIPDSWVLLGVSPGRMLIWFALTALVAGIVVSVISGVIYLKAFARFYIDKCARETTTQNKSSKQNN